MLYISDLLNSSNQLFIGLSETWLRDQLDAELHIDNYKLFRTDRTRTRNSRFGRDSGGVAIYLRSDLAPAFEQVISHSDGNVEACGVYSKSENIFFVVLYRQPDDRKEGNRPTKQQFLQVTNSIQNFINSISPTLDIILGGDFNLPHAKWDSFTHKSGASLDEQRMINIMRHIYVMTTPCSKSLNHQRINGATSLTLYSQTILTSSIVINVTKHYVPYPTTTLLN